MDPLYSLIDPRLAGESSQGNECHVDFEMVAEEENSVQQAGDIGAALGSTHSYPGSSSAAPNDAESTEARTLGIPTVEDIEYIPGPPYKCPFPGCKARLYPQKGSLK